jgi:quinol monooxygenase YgiN
MFRTSIRMQVPVKKRNEVLAILGSFAQATRAEPGCVFCRVYQDVEEKDVFMLEELWSAEECLVRHLGPYEFNRVLLVAELSSTPPEIRFETVERTTGIETIEKARNLLGHE